MIDLVYKTVQTFLAKDRNGLVSPTQFDYFATLAQDSILKEYFTDENRDKTRQNRGLTNSGYSNLPFNVRQRIDVFAASENVVYDGINSRYNLPDDLYLLEDNGITYSSGAVIEEVQRSDIGYLSRSISAPSSTYPTYERYPNYILVYPTSLTNNITVRYIRKPLTPKWTYYVVGDTPMFDPSNPSYQDFELNPSEFSNLVVRILSYFSISIKDLEVAQIAETFKDKIKLNENS